MAFRRTRDQRGSAAVEFALIMPIFLMLLFGIIDFGYMINRSSVINNAARDAVRMAAFSSSTEADVLGAANATLGGIPNTTVTITCLESNGTTCDMDSKPNGGMARVSVAYQHRMLTPVGMFVPGGFDLTRTAEMRFEPR